MNIIHTYIKDIRKEGFETPKLSFLCSRKWISLFLPSCWICHSTAYIQFEPKFGARRSTQNFWTPVSSSTLLQLHPPFGHWDIDNLNPCTQIPSKTKELTQVRKPWSIIGFSFLSETWKTDNTAKNWLCWSETWKNHLYSKQLVELVCARLFHHGCQDAKVSFPKFKPIQTLSLPSLPASFQKKFRSVLRCFSECDTQH